MIRTAKLGALFAAAALASACSTTTNGTTGGTTGATGTTSGTTTSGTTTGTSTTTTSTSSSSSGSTDAGPYCNGVQLATDDGGGTTAYLATYPKSDDIRLNCTHAMDPYEFGYDAGSGATETTIYGTLWDLSGILDRNTNVLTGTLYTVWPAGCDDLDAGAAPTAGTVVPDGGTTIAAALVTAESGSATTIPGPVYGVVTFITAPYTSDTGAHSGSAWIQDPVATGGTPAPNSGVQLYFPKASANDAGAMTAGLYPPVSLTRGDVIALTNLTWDPYVAKGNTTGLSQNEFEFGATATLTLLGPGTLPPAVELTAQQLNGDAGAFYMGMRVVQTDGPDTVVNACPVPLQSSAN